MSPRQPIWADYCGMMVRQGQKRLKNKETNAMRAEQITHNTKRGGGVGGVIALTLSTASPYNDPLLAI